MKIDDFAQNWPAPSHPMPIVIVGAGGIVRDAHLPAYAKAGLPVVAVVDLDPSRAAEVAALAGAARALPTLEDAVAVYAPMPYMTLPCRLPRSSTSCRSFRMPPRR